MLNLLTNTKSISVSTFTKTVMLKFSCSSRQNKTVADVVFTDHHFGRMTIV